MKSEKNHSATDIPVRDVFKKLVPLAANKGMHIAIVTFAEHTQLIEDVVSVHLLCTKHSVKLEIAQKGIWRYDCTKNICSLE